MSAELRAKKVARDGELAKKAAFAKATAEKVRRPFYH